MRRVSSTWFWPAILGVALLAPGCGSDNQSSASRADGGGGVAGVGGDGGDAGSGGYGGDGGDAGSGGDGGGSGGGSSGLDAGTGGGMEGGVGADSGHTNSDAGPGCPSAVPVGTCSLPFGTPCFYGSTTCVCVNDWVCDSGDAGSDAGPVAIPEGGLIQQCSGAADCGVDVCCAWSVGTQCLPAAGCAVLGGTVIP